MTEPLPWWSTRFIRALTAMGILLPAPGQGRVVSLAVGPGRVDAEVQDRLISAEPRDPDDRSPALTDVMDTFFDSGEAPGLGGAAPLYGPRTSSDALVDQAPPFAITAGGEDVAELLRPVYRALTGE